MTIAPIERVYLDGLDYVIIYMMMIISWFLSQQFHEHEVHQRGFFMPPVLAPS